ncbi:MAG: adenine deaminase [Fulvivirga sp.]|nr:adenine deaminase [Fulvivirga sp.]
MTISGKIIDVLNKRIFDGTITVRNGIISDVRETSVANNQFIMPGFIDAHVHIESSMLVPSEFARLAVVHGTVATVSDPHEIGNVLGVEGVEYMIENGNKVPFKFYFGAPSCVPATPFETAGAEIDAKQLKYLLEKPEVKYMAEMMNWPGVLNREQGVMEKIQIAQALEKPVDGHAPGLKGEKARDYIAAGISTDHECFTREEALDKLDFGMHVVIREGSAAKNFDALIGLLKEYPDQMMFCSDDKHPDNLVEGHINSLVKRAIIEKGIELFKVLQAACVNPVKHYDLDVGLLQKNDPADFIIVDNPHELNVLKTYINGKLVADAGKTRISAVENKVINNFSTSLKQPQDFEVEAKGGEIRVIEAADGQLVTREKQLEPKVSDDKVVSDTDRDILKMAVINRYADQKPAVAFISQFGLKSGGIASSVGHDSHNIIVVGVDDESMTRAVNLLIDARGGVAAVDGSQELLLALPVAGIMSPEDGYSVAEQYKAIDQMAKKMGSTLESPFMTLSFMALLVIPQLKLSDQGLFDGEKFKFTDLFVDP